MSPSHEDWIHCQRCGAKLKAKPVSRFDRTTGRKYIHKINIQCPSIIYTEEDNKHDFFSVTYSEDGFNSLRERFNIE